MWPRTNDPLGQIGLRRESGRAISRQSEVRHLLVGFPLSTRRTTAALDQRQIGILRMLKSGPSELLTIRVIGFVGPGRASNLWKASPLVAALLASPHTCAQPTDPISCAEWCTYCCAVASPRRGKRGGGIVVPLQQQKYLDNFRGAINVTDAVLQL